MDDKRVSRLLPCTGIRLGQVKGQKAKWKWKSRDKTLLTRRLLKYKWRLPGWERVCAVRKTDTDNVMSVKVQHKLSDTVLLSLGCIGTPRK